MQVELSFENASVALGDNYRAHVKVTNDDGSNPRLPAIQLAHASVSLEFQRADGSVAKLIRLQGPVDQVAVDTGASIEGTLELPAVETGAFQVTAIYNPGRDASKDLSAGEGTRSEPSALSVTGEGNLNATIETEEGPVTLEFWPDRALNHVSSFVELANRGYYDGIVIHRVVPGFVIQGGDPTGTGGGGPGYKIPAEFNDAPHEVGVLSMARTPDPHSAGSQFFLCTAQCSSLDNQYTVFGKVTDGIERVLKIGESESNAGRYHLQKVTVQG